MRHTPHYLLTDPADVRRLAVENPWMTFVSPASTGLVASHYAALVEEDPADPDAITIVTHFGRPDEVAHELGQHEVMVIVQGPHGYISPNWYAPGDLVPTWNHVTAHLHGTPEILEADENFRVLERLVARFENRMPEPVTLDGDPEKMRRIALGTVGLRIRVTRFDARAKLSQNKTPDVRERIITELDGDGPYANRRLAAEMRRMS